MAGNIKGITIEFQGDTTKLDQSIRGVDKETAKIDNELRKVNRDLKFNPTSIDLWRQKQALLTQKIQDTQSKLDMLKQKQKDMDARGVDKNSEEYRKLQREIIETESKLKTFKGQLKQVGNVKLRVASEQLKQIGSKATAAGNAMRGLSRAAALVTAAGAALAVKTAKWADNVNTLSKKYHIGTRELQLYAAAAGLVDVDVETIAKSHVKLAKSMDNANSGSKKQAEAFKKLGIEITNSDGTLRDADEVWQETISALGEMDDETERDALAMRLMGKSATELNPLIEDGGKTYKNVADTMKKYGLDFVDQKTLDNANKFNDALDTIKAVGLLAFQTLGAKLAGYFAPILDKVVAGVGKLAKWISGLNPVVLAVGMGIAALVAAIAPALLLFGALATAAGAVTGALAAISAPMIAIAAGIAAFVAVIGTALASSKEFRAALSSLFASLAQLLLPVVKQAVKAFKQLFAIIGDTIKEVANQLAPVIKALTPVILLVAKLLIARLKFSFKAIVTVVKILCAVVKSAAAIFRGTFQALGTLAVGAYTRIKGAFSKVKNALTHPFETAKNVIKGIIDKIKGFFNFHVSTPHIPLPHFAISPPGWKIGDLVKGKIPSLSIRWYAKGGIFNKPTVLSGLGEAGPEAVVPLDKFWRKLEEMQSGDVIVNVYGSDNMSVNELAEAVEQKIIQMQKRRRVAWQ